MASPSAKDPPAGSPTAIRPAAISSASTPQAPAATPAAAASAACRPTAVEPTSSSRPASSSALVCLTTVKMPIRAAATAANAPYFQAVSAPTEVPNSGPVSASTAGLWAVPAATCSRDARVL